MTILDGFIQLLTMAYDGSLSSQIFSKGILVCGWATPLKNMSSSVGMIIPNIWKKIFQTTNQYLFGFDMFWYSP